MKKIALKVSCVLVSLFVFATAQAEILSERSINAPIDSSEILPVETPPALVTPGGNEPLKGNYTHLDPSHLINDQILRQAVAFYDFNLEKLANKNYMTIVDFNMHSNQRRMFIVNMKTGAVTPVLTAAGVKSDPDQDGYATFFSNKIDSHQSSLGFYYTTSTYQGQNGLSLRLHGMNATNSNAYERLIVLHGTTKYVFEDRNLAKNQSWGCPAVDDSVIKDIIDRVKGGSVLFISHSSLVLN